VGLTMASPAGTRLGRDAQPRAVAFRAESKSRSSHSSLGIAIRN